MELVLALGHLALLLDLRRNGLGVPIYTKSEAKEGSRKEGTKSDPLEREGGREIRRTRWWMFSVAQVLDKEDIRQTRGNN
jgi:hypothetical protein